MIPHSAPGQQGAESVFPSCGPARFPGGRHLRLSRGEERGAWSGAWVGARRAARSLPPPCPSGNEPGRRILSPQLHGTASVRNIRFRYPPDTPRLGETIATQALSPGGNGCRAPPATRRDAGSGPGVRGEMDCIAPAHTHNPLTPSGVSHPRCWKTCHTPAVRTRVGRWKRERLGVSQGGPRRLARTSRTFCTSEDGANGLPSRGKPPWGMSPDTSSTFSPGRIDTSRPARSVPSASGSVTSAEECRGRGTRTDSSPSTFSPA